MLQVDSFGSLFGTMLVDDVIQSERIMMSKSLLSLLCQLSKFVLLDVLCDFGLFHLQFGKTSKMPPFGKYLLQLSTRVGFHVLIVHPFGGNVRHESI